MSYLESGTPKRRGNLKHLPIEITTQTDFARSHSTNWSPKFPIASELEAIWSLKDARTDHSDHVSVYDRYQSGKPVMIIDLHDFEVYRSPQSSYGRQFELVGLHQLEVPRTKQVCFDGLTRINGSFHYIQSVPIHDTSIEGYGERDNPRVVVYIQSARASQDADYNIWFKLHRPSPGYRRFHEPFMWVAQLGKHVIDYLEDHPGDSIGLDNFRVKFHQWIEPRFRNKEDFRKWHSAFKDRTDFRVSVNAYIEYIYRQAFNLSSSKTLLTHPLWRDCMAGGLTRVKAEPEIEEYTLTSSEVYESFKHMYFGPQLRKAKTSSRVEADQQRRKRQLGFPEHRSLAVSSSQPNASPICQPYGEALIKIGDIVALEPQTSDKQVWKSTDSEWLAYVQGTELLDDGIQQLSVIWLYRPSDTNIFKAIYPFTNELFFSDNCNCEDGDLLSTDVKGFYDVQWSPTVLGRAKLFIRQTYITQDSAFISHEERHKTCICKKVKPSTLDGFRPGDTVYMEKTVRGQKILEPVIIQNIERSFNRVNVRRLARLYRDCSEMATEAPPRGFALNELALTDEYEELNASRIKHRCSVRFVPKEDLLKGAVPFPYNRDGAGDFWFLSMRVTTTGKKQHLSFLDERPKAFNEDFDSTKKVPKLRGLSIFSGGGSLDRGLEEGGAVRFDTAVDFSSHAIHTQRANRKNSKMRLYCGSVDDYLRLAFSGKQHPSVVRVGYVDLIAAGSPCPGFSALQQNFFSEQSLRNASHITTFCSFVDLYRPLYGVLENVVNMASTRKGLEDQNVLSQLVACLVSMGYQVNQYIMDAWNYGSAQHRSRVLLTIAAPGLNPIRQPRHTHSRPYEETAGRSLGTLPNGERFGDREHYPTPFPYVSAGEITADLPNIGNGQVQTCIPFPDHHLSQPYNFKERALLKYIPKYPPGSGYKEAQDLDIIPPSLRKPKKEIGKAYCRIKESGLVPTITAGLSIQDARNGAAVHWSEDRSISILEARRTQGYPDHEPIIGTSVDQYRIIGNGVDRKVSFALGMSLRHAVRDNSSSMYHLSSAEEDEEEPYDSPVEVHDDPSDSESVQSMVDVQTLPTDLQANRPWTLSVVIPQRRDNSVSVKSRSESLVNSILQPTKVADTSPTPARLLSRLSLSPMTRTDIPVITRTPSSQTRVASIKRTIEEVEESEIDDVFDLPEAKPAKRAKSSPMSPASDTTVEADLTEMQDGTKPSSANRRTRHSYLQVEFVPKHWNMKPEQEHRKE